MRLLLTLLMAAMLAGCGEARSKFASTDITGASFGQGFALTDASGKLRKLEDFRGKVVVVFFGFTQCPDVCPTTLSKMAQVMELLGPDARKLQTLFVTLDPERDTPELLSRDVPQFHPSFIGLYSDLSGTAAVARDFKVFFQKSPTSGTQYTIDHTTGSYVFDPQGRVRLFTDHGATAEVLASDIRQLIKGK